MMVRIECKGSGLIDIDDIKPIQGNLKNLSKENYDKLKKQILDLGFSAPFFIWENKILDGTQRWNVLQKMRAEAIEIPKLPYVQIEAKNKKEAMQKLLSFASQYGNITNQGLYEFAHEAGIEFDELKGSFSFPEIKFDKFESEFFDKPTEGNTPDDEVPTIKESFVKMGEIWKLGRHRILCGDSTDRVQVEKLMNGEKADMVYTDPPYGVDYDGGTTKREKLKGDDTTDLYGPACSMAYQFSIDEAPLYIWHAGTLAAAAAAAAAKWQIRSELIWNKNMAQFGALSAQYKQKHEPFYYCFKVGKKVNWRGPTNEVSVWDEKRSSKNEFHPTQKPTELAERAIRNHSVKSLLDLFLGSGASLIACEKLGKKCFGIELSEMYCSVIIKRWENFTGQKAILETGQNAGEIQDAQRGHPIQKRSVRKPKGKASASA